ncbi:MAG: tauD2 [Actinomycetia bacterium]|nr:tauD2 [Actinomycetes bacterium]
MSAPAIDVRRIAGHIGAEITGIQVRPGLKPGTVAFIRSALLEHKVIFFRGQEHLDDAGQAGFARLFGGLTTAHPTVPGTGDAHVLELDAQRGGGKANAWHTDVTFVDRPPAISVLRAVTLPPYGGDTAWANTVAAYESLSPALRSLAQALWALHSNDYDYAALSGGGVTAGKSARDERHYREVFTSTVYQTEHPVVRVHPETGERALLLGQFVRRILGVGAGDSRHLFELFQQHVTRLENTVRWRWAPGDVAVWDNRSTQHYAIDDYGDLPRKVHRVTIAGDQAASVDGQLSRAIAGDSAAYVLA